MISNDFNGDGRSDLIVNSVTDGARFLFATTTGFLWGPSAPSVFAGTGDFNGDGREDLLQQGPVSTTSPSTLSSELQTWAGGAHFETDYDGATVVPAGWQVIGTGDFNGDHKTDVLFRNQNGLVTDWLIGPPDSTLADVGPDAPFVPNAGATSAVPLSWHVLGVDDFNGDGRDDLLWRNDSGVITDWLSTNTGTFTSNWAYASFSVPVEWKVAATGDFNGDGKADIFWQDTNGAVVTWLGNGNGGFSADWAHAAMAVGSEWHVVANGDYNGDNRDDLLWQSDDGTLSQWLGQADGSFLSNGFISLAGTCTVLNTSAHDTIT